MDKYLKFKELELLSDADPKKSAKLQTPGAQRSCAPGEKKEFAAAIGKHFGRRNIG